MSWQVSRDDATGQVLIEADYLYATDDEARQLAQAIIEVAARRADYLDGWGGRRGPGEVDE